MNNAPSVRKSSRAPMWIALKAGVLNTKRSRETRRANSQLAYQVLWLQQVGDDPATNLRLSRRPAALTRRDL